MHYYQFNIGDYAKRTRHLSNIEDLAYRRLLDLYYLNEQPIENNIKKIARLVNMREYVQEVESVLEDFFVLKDEAWTNKRADEGISLYNAKADTARENGKKGGRPKKPRPNPEETQPVNLANPEETGSKAKHKPLTNNQEPLNNNQLKEKKEKKKNTRGTRLDKNWIPENEDCAFLFDNRPDLDLTQTVESFKDYWTAAAGAKAVKLDWSATWRNWVRNSRKDFNASKTKATFDQAEHDEFMRGFNQ